VFTLRAYLNQLKKQLKESDTNAHKLTAAILREGALLENETLEETEKRTYESRYVSVLGGFLMHGGFEGFLRSCSSEFRAPDSIPTLGAL